MIFRKKKSHDTATTPEDEAVSKTAESSMLRFEKALQELETVLRQVPRNGGRTKSKRSE